MKRLLLPLLAALALPTAVNAMNSIERGVAKIVWQDLQKLQTSAQTFADMSDYEAACRWEGKAIKTIESNFEDLQELLPSVDMFAFRKASIDAERAMCDAARLDN